MGPYRAPATLPPRHNTLPPAPPSSALTVARHRRPLHRRRLHPEPQLRAALDGLQFPSTESLVPSQSPHGLVAARSEALIRASIASATCLEISE